MTTTPDDGAARFELLYREHRPRVGAYLRRRGAVDPDGLAADVFLTLWRRLPEVTGPELPWLYRTAGYLLANDRRSRATAGRVPGLLADERTLPGPALGTDPGAGIEGAPDDDLARALRSLAPPDREVLLLVAWEDLEGAGLAAALGCSRVAARARLSRARRRLATALARGPAADGHPDRPPPHPGDRGTSTDCPRPTTAVTGDPR